MSVRHWNVAEPAVSVVLQDARYEGVLMSQQECAHVES